MSARKPKAAQDKVSTIEGPLQSTEEREKGFFERLFLISPIGIFIVQKGRFRFVNPAFTEISGYKAEQLLGMDSLAIVHPDDRSQVRAHAVEMLKGKRSTPYQHRVMTPNGEVRWIIESVVPITYQGEDAVLGYFMDTTEYELAKEAMALSEEKFHKAFRSSPDWFVITTLEDGFYVDVNDAFLRATGYRRDEVIGHTSSELGIWVDPRQRHEIVRRLREEGSVRDVEVQFRMKSGEIRHMLWSAEVIDYGEEPCCLAMTRDITSRVRAQEERIQREKLQGILELAGAACHELNQPLQYIYLLLSEAMEEQPDSRALREMKSQLDRLRDITAKLENITVYETMDYIKGRKIVDINKACRPQG